jgi:hypothetical protein
MTAAGSQERGACDMRRWIDRRAASGLAFRKLAAAALGLPLGVVAFAAMAASPASAQDANLTGRWKCLAFCVDQQPGGFAFITQNGWELNIVNETGEASRAWVNYPGRIWIDRLDQGAIYSPDGVMLQFDRGTLWQRVVDLPPPVRVRLRHK